MGKKSLIAGRYEVQAALGRGGGGRVLLVRDILQGGRPAALKMVGIPRGGASPLLADLKNEFTTLSLLRHRNLARVFDFGITRKEMYFTSEWVDGKDLLAATRHADFNAIFDLIAQILRAVDYIHKRGVLHLDLKPANILATGRDASGVLTARVIDFGIAEWKRRGQIHETDFLGTPPFAAPEILLRKPPTAASDLYSLGMLFHLIFAKRFPFPSQKPFEILRWQTTRDPDFLPCLHPALPEEFSKWLHAMVARHPAARPQSAGEVLEALGRCLGESFPLRDVNAPAHLLGESDFFFHTKLIASLAGRLKRKRRKILALVGPAGAGKSRLLRRVKADLQLQGISSCYFRGAAEVREILSRRDVKKCPMLLDLEGDLPAAARKKLAAAAWASPLLVALEHEDQARALGAEIVRLPALDRSVLSRFLEVEIRGIPKELGEGLLGQLRGIHPARLEECLQALREAGNLVWQAEGWRWKGGDLPDLRAILERHAGLWEDRKRSIRAVLENSYLSLPASALEGLIGLAPGALERPLERWLEEGWLNARWEGNLRCFQSARPTMPDDPVKWRAVEAATLVERLKDLYEAGRYSAGVALVDFLERRPRRKLHLRVRLHAARHLVAEGHVQRALDWLPSRLPPEPEERGLLWEIRARAYQRLGRVPEARRALNRAEAAYASGPDARGTARVFNLRGSFAKDEARFEEAEACFQAAARSALSVDDDYLAGTAQTNLALAYQERGEIQRALLAYESAWDHCRKSYHPKLANVLFHNWINLEHHMGRSSEAEKSCYEWLQLAVRHRYPEQEASALNYLALFAGQRRLLDLQGSFLNQAIALVNPAQNPRLFAQLCANRALLHWSRENFPAAQRDGETALNLCHQRPGDPLLAWVYLVLGKVARDRPNPDLHEATRLFEAAESNVLKNRTRQLLWEVEYDRGKLEKRLGRPARARHFFRSAQSALENLEKNLPPAFKESYLRDRKSDRIRWELENLESHGAPSEFPETLPLRPGTT